MTVPTTGSLSSSQQSFRYALICSNCNGHNGMAMPAEFEYLAFQCYICGTFNPARKLRPSMSAMAALGSRPLPPPGAAAPTPLRPSFRSTEKKNDEVLSPFISQFLAEQQRRI